MTVDSFRGIDPRSYTELVRLALAEDGRGCDVTTKATIAPEQRAKGIIRSKSECVLAGLDVALETFEQVDPGVVVTRLHEDGDWCCALEVVACVEGSAAGLLSAERTALNFVQRLSGIATLTHRFVAAVDGRTRILDTRKTTPTLRSLEKYAVRAGGGENHRFALDDGVLIKDNHVRVVGSISLAVAKARSFNHNLEVVVEVSSLEELNDAIEAGASRVLLDNFSIDDCGRAIVTYRDRVKIEVSGGVTLDNVEAIAALGPDYISIGALTHSAPAIDISFDVSV